MTKQTKRLGRGMDALVSDLRHVVTTPQPGGTTSRETDLPPAERADHPEHATPTLPVDRLDPNPFQPRFAADPRGIASLAESIRRSGVLQPIAVRAAGARYQIIAGQRRWEAARHAGLRDVPVVIRDATEEEMLELALIENIQREDLNAIDRAKAYRRYCTDFGLTAEDVAHRVGEDRTTVTNYIRLLDLPPAIRTLIAEGRLSMGHGRCLLGCPDPERQVQLAEDAVAGHLSVRTIEDLVRRHRHTADAAPDATGVAQDGRSAHIRDLERRFEDIVKTKVTIHEGRRRGTGRITIEYYSLDDFDRIASLIGIAPE